MTGATLDLVDVELAVRRPVPTHILGPVTLRLDRHGSTAVVGRSGAGKSSLASVLGALVAPTAGTYRFGDVDVGRLSPRGRAALRADHVGFVFQAAHVVDGRSALENVLLGTALQPRPRRERAADARAALAAVGLAGEADRDVRVMSGGERQRVAVARALVGSPSLVVADEPTGNLDSATGGAVLDLLLDVVTERAGLVMITHDPAAAARADRVVELRDGLVVADGAPEDAA